MIERRAYGVPGGVDDYRMIEHRPAGGGFAEWHPTPAELPLDAIKALGRRMERSSSITPQEADAIVRQHGGRLPSAGRNPAVMVKLLKVARAEHRSRGVDAGPAAPKEFRLLNASKLSKHELREHDRRALRMRQVERKMQDEEMDRQVRAMRLRREKERDARRRGGVPLHGLYVDAGTRR